MTIFFRLKITWQSGQYVTTLARDHWPGVKRTLCNLVSMHVIIKFLKEILVTSN